MRAINTFHATGRVLAQYLASFDVVLTPALTQLPAELGRFTMRSLPFLAYRGEVARYASFLAVVNAAGLPAASLPFARSRCGLPIGVQLIGRFGDERTLLMLSAAIEEARPWAHLRPPR